MTATVLATGRPSYFRFEGAARFGLRAGFCLQGMGWRVSDDLAADIVGTALRRIGAQRPSDEEASRGYAESVNTYCMWEKCGKVMPAQDDTNHKRTKFCSDECRTAHKNWAWAKDRRAELAATAKAYRDAKREGTPARPCEWCAKPFKPLIQANRPEPRFCGASCATRWKNAQRRVQFGHILNRRRRKPRPDKSCGECGRMFVPDFDGKKFCNKLCSNRANLKKAQRLPFLGEDVKPNPAPAPEPAPALSFECEATLTPEEIQRRAQVLEAAE